MPRIRPPPFAARKAAAAWAAAFVRNCNGRFECEQEGLKVPELLRNLGYVVRPVDVETYEVELPPWCS